MSCLNPIENLIVSSGQKLQAVLTPRLPKFFLGNHVGLKSCINMHFDFVYRIISIFLATVNRFHHRSNF